MPLKAEFEIYIERLSKKVSTNSQAFIQVGTPEMEPQMVLDI